MSFCQHGVIPSNEDPTVTLDMLEFLKAQKQVPSQELVQCKAGAQIPVSSPLCFWQKRDKPTTTNYVGAHKYNIYNPNCTCIGLASSK